MWDEIKRLTKELETIYDLISPVYMQPASCPHARAGIEAYAKSMMLENPEESRRILKKLEKLKHFSAVAMIQKENRLHDLIDLAKLEGYVVETTIPNRRRVH